MIGTFGSSPQPLLSPNGEGGGGALPSELTVSTPSLRLCVATAVHVGEALGPSSRYSQLGDVTAVEVQPRADGTVVRFATRAGFEPFLGRVLGELWLLLVLAALRACAGTPARVRAVRLPPAPRRVALELSDRDLAKPIEGQAPDGLPSIGLVARRLGVSQRTLQRRLAESGLNFRALIDDVRRELALQYVRLPDLPIKQISSLLGYSSPNAFIRAFRRWSGTTPAEYVRAHIEAPDAGGAERGTVPER